MTKAEILANAAKEKRTLLTEVESKDLLKAARIPVVETRLAKSKAEAVELASKLGFPVVMKIVSPDVVHKSDAGGVKLSIENATQAGKAYGEILANIKKHYPKAKIIGVQSASEIKRNFFSAWKQAPLFMSQTMCEAVAPLPPLPITSTAFCRW